MTVSSELDPVRLRLAVAAALAAWRHTAAEGTVRMLFVSPPAIVRAGFDLPEPVERLDELYLRDLVAQIERIGTPGAVIAIARPHGRPQRRDRQLCREVAERLLRSPTRLADVLTVGDAREWSVLNHRR